MYDEKEEVFKKIDVEKAEQLKTQGQPVFAVGDEHELNGVLMRIRKITRKDIVLRRVKKATWEHKIKEE